MNRCCYPLLLLLLMGGFFEGCRPEACIRDQPPTQETGFGVAVAVRGQPFSEWQEDAHRLLKQSLGLPRFVSPAPRAMEYPASGDIRGLVVLIHGHGGTRNTIMQLGATAKVRGLGPELASKGWLVIAPEIRSFGDFPKGVKHKDYVRRIPSNSFLPLVLAEVSKAIDQTLVDQSNQDIILVGHSLGSHLALHLAALRRMVKGVFLSGLFVPTACINSSAHHFCQHHEALAKVLTAEDLALLIAPRRLHVFFGEKDEFYTPATAALIGRTKRYFTQVGAADRMSVTIKPNVGHWLDREAVLRFVEELDTKKKVGSSDRDQ